MADLEARIRHLEDIEAIKRLKYKYFRCLDSKLWNEMAECFAEDATTDYADGKLRFQGVAAIMQFLREAMGRDTLLSIHQGHHPEIEMTSETTAKGVWEFYDYLIDTQANISIRGAAFIYEEYAKEKGKWKIKSTGYTRIFEEVWDRGETKSLNLTARKEFAQSEESI
jgi:hypothetical protein